MGTLVDTSVWVDHLRHASRELTTLLHEDRVLCHPLIVGELACGSLSQRDEILAFFALLPQAPILEFHEVLTFIERHRLYGRGLGWIDIHVLAASLLADATLWTRDRALQQVAQELGCCFDPRMT